ncbi:MAG: glucose 1-dehydrogenase [Pirellulaceae bacterium]
MRGLIVTPLCAGSVRLGTIPEPPTEEGAVLVEAVACGVCGTDREIMAGLYGQAPEREEMLVLGHESLGRVLEAPHGSGLAVGDLVVGIVRRPDPVPCPNCAVGQWDMCRNGLYTECGIKGRHGFCRERFRLDPGFAVKVDATLDRVGVLVEPASVLAKAWEHIRHIGERALWKPEKVLVTGAGPVGLLAALMAVQQGFEVHVLDRTLTGPKPQLVRDLGGRYHTSSVQEACSGADIVIECTGATRLIFDAMQNTALNGIVCLTGISSGGRNLTIDLGGLNREIVLENDVIFGSVNANRTHYERAAEVLQRADREWLERLITRRVPIERWREALERQPDDVKTVLEFS